MRGGSQMANSDMMARHLAEIERLSSTGGFFWHPAMNEMTCTDEVYRIFELDPGVPLTLELMSTRIHPDDLRFIDDMRARAGAQHSGFEYQLRLRTQRVKYLVLSACRSAGAEDQPLYVGAIQDVSRHRLSVEAPGYARSEMTRLARASSLGTLT